MKLRHVLPFVLLPATLLFSAGCASSPKPDFYVLNAEAGWRGVASRDVAESAFIVRFAPLNLPDYLDRPNLVVREDLQQIRREPFHRWGIPLDKVVVETVGAAIAYARPQAFVDVVTQRMPPASGYLVHIDLVRLDGHLGGEVELIAQWRVTRGDQKDDENVAQRLDRYEERATGPTHAEYVEAIRVLLSRLGKDIASVMED